MSFLDLDEMSRSYHKVKGHRRAGVCVLWMLLVFISFYYTSTKSWRGYIFIAVCVCVCASESVCQWTRFLPNQCTDLDAVFAKYDHIVNRYSEKFAIKKDWKVFLIKKISTGCELAWQAAFKYSSVSALTDCAIDARYNIFNNFLSLSSFSLHSIRLKLYA